MKFIYTDKHKSAWVKGKTHGQLVAPVIFECEAENILEADALYEKATGQKASKQGHVGCEIKS